MSQFSSVPAIDASPVQDILLAMRFDRRERGLQFEATSLPGHLLHLIVAGHVRQECNGREYELRPGCVMWYHDDELVRGTFLRVPWVCYSINFIAPELPPPPFESRLYRNRLALRPYFVELVATWNNLRLPPLVRKLRAHAALLRILAGLALPEQQPFHMNPKAKLWWELETTLRKDLRQPVSLRQMSELSQASPATIARACQLAVGMSPAKRLKQVRLNLARGLVLRSRLSMKEIAERVGYGRVHEFSRDYHKHFGNPPTTDRHAEKTRSHPSLSAKVFPTK